MSIPFDPMRNTGIGGGAVWPTPSFVPLPSEDTLTHIQTGTIHVAFPKDVPSRVAHILNEVLNLTVWEYEIFAEECDKLLEGKAVRMPE